MRARKGRIRQKGTRSSPKLLEGRENSQDLKPHRAWEKVAPFYEEQLQRDDSLHRTVLAPHVLRLLEPFPRGRILEIGCGTGFFARLLHEKGWEVVGVDPAREMIERAVRQGPPGITYIVEKGETLARVKGRFSAALSVMAIQNMEAPERMFMKVRTLLEPYAPFLLVTLHPCFRFPRQSSWGYDPDKKLIFRRMDRYLTPLRVPIQMYPGRAPEIVTYTYHRPLSVYVQALSEAGFMLDALEEWISPRRSTTGPRASAENRARQEFPLFLAIRARAVVPPP